MLLFEDDTRSAIFDSTRTYRYSLTRALPPRPGAGHPAKPRRVLWIMLNPSTADEETNDPTICRCLDFSRRWGFNELEVVNLFAYRATHPEQMLTADDPVGPDNDRMIAEAMARADLVLAAWGRLGKSFGRADEVREIAREHKVELWHLGTTKEGEPRHPLYMRGTTEREAGEARRR